MAHDRDPPSACGRDVRNPAGPSSPTRTASRCGGGWVQASRVVVNDLFSGGADEGATGGPAATSEPGPSARPLEPGDVVTVFTPGGGGWGR
jgi:N-methylhydantoinase B/oxoprolinase/acetone carboxylase alpha subunit